METKYTSSKSINKQPHFLKLTRMENELTRMLSELHSYRCEPCTPDMHEQYLELNSSGNQLKQTIDSITYLVKESSKQLNDRGEEVMEIMKKYHIFQKNLSSYLAEAIMHH